MRFVHPVTAYLSPAVGPARKLAVTLAALLGSAGASAQVAQVVEIAQLAQAQLGNLQPLFEPAEGYDWSVLIAAGFGLLGLYWIRRHVNRL